MGKNEEPPFEPGKFRQFIAAVVVNLSCLTYGTMVGWPSPAALELQSPDPPVGTEPMTDEETSWLSGIMCLAGTMMTLITPYLMEKFGRKVTGCLTALPFGLSWLLIIFATEHAHIFIARFFSGIGGGACLFLVPLYVSEISCDSVRGMLGSLLVFILNIGILIAYVLGDALSFRMFAICAMLVPVIYLGAFLFMPESPLYLVRKNRLHEAAKSLMWLKAGHKPSVEQELLKLQAMVKKNNATGKKVGYRDLFRDRGTIKALIITLGLFGGQQLCGIFAMVSYTGSIFKTAGSSMSPNMAAITVGTIQVFGSYLSTSLMERMGRRPLLLISSIGMCVCHYVLGTFCYLQVLKFDVAAFGWIPVVSLSIYMIVYCLGLGPGPYVVASEIFSTDISSLAITTGLLFVWTVAFLVVKFFANLVILLDMYGCFFLLGTFCLGSFVFIFFLVPETKGRSREAILNELNGIPYAVSKEYVSSKENTSKTLPLPEQV